MVELYFIYTGTLLNASIEASLPASSYACNIPRGNWSPVIQFRRVSNPSIPVSANIPLLFIVIYDDMLIYVIYYTSSTIIYNRSTTYNYYYLIQSQKHE